MKIDNLEIKKHFFGSLNERQRRQFTALEAKNIGHGGIKAVSEAFGISVVTIREGIAELENQDKLAENRVRRNGGGRKKNYK